MVSTGLLATSLVAPVPAGAQSGALRTVATFNRAANETPENLVIEPDGTIYLSFAFASELRRISPNGEQATISLPTGGGITVGLAADFSHGSDLDVAVKSGDASDAGIWRVPLAAFDDPSVQPTRIAALPTNSFPNGMRFGTEGDLFIADSALGAIWELAPGSSTPTIWAEGPLLQPTGASFDNFPLPGANGLYLHDGTVYVSNTSTNEILAVPILPDGAAGQITVRFQIDAPDDFAITQSGVFYVAQNVASQLSRISADGMITTLATAADGLANTSSARFGTSPGTQSLLYITNSAYFGGTPSLQVMRPEGLDEGNR